MKKPKRVVQIGPVKIGGDNPIIVQSMTKTKTRDTKRTISQIRRLERAGCELVRLAVVNNDDVLAIRAIKDRTSIPIIADIHFDHRLALGVLNQGIDKIRINPGNIDATWKIEEIIKCAMDKNIPIRVGVNSGSLSRLLLARYGHPTPEAIVQAVTESLALFLKKKFLNVVISAKGANVRDTILAYQSLHRRFDLPLHLGITEAGLPFRGAIKSGVGLGTLLFEGIGDTIRVSLTADPVLEVVAAYEILNALDLRRSGPVLISCPVCGRCEVELARIAQTVETRLKQYRNYMKVAVMGCVVNGPGEAREADFGIACGKGIGAIFAKGKEIKRVKETKLVDSLFEVIDENINN
jgi:(E)-4-hydroxy-3-methylbut-2-enyl-diphosphate synthase